ncbi:MAG TPA: ABC transporter ATP-binding protein [Desulfobacterales bacterium]
MQTDFGYFEEKQLGKSYDLRLLKRLIPYTRPYRLALTASILLVVSITLMELSLPYITKIAIDRYIVPKQQQAAFPERETSKRWIRADLSDPRVGDIVVRNPQLFRSETDGTWITFESIRRLPPEDIAVLRKNDLRGLAGIAVVFTTIVLLNFAFNFAQRWTMEYTGHRMMHDLRLRLFAHIQDAAVPFFNRNPVGRLVTRTTNDIQNMHELFTSVISFVFKDLFLLLGIAAVLLALNWKLALATFIVLPGVLYASAVFSKRARRIFRRLRVQVAEINTRFSETINGIKVIQLFRNEASNYRGFRRMNHENYLTGMQQIRILGLFLPAIEVLGVTAVAIVVFYGGGQVVAGALTLGSLVAFISYMKMFFRPIRDLAEKYNILQNAMASAERIFLIFDDEATQPRRPSAARTETIDTIETIRLESVNFRYNGGEPVLKEIDLTIRAGETIGIVGPTGSGKTTLIHLLTRFYDPSGGRICINGIDLRRLDPGVYRSSTALVMQDPFLFSESIRDNIFRGHSASRNEEQIQAVLEQSNCAELIQRLPQGLDTELSEGGLSLSSGERQLISIARAFARNPQLILFDEATSYIDTQTEIKIQQALEELMQGRTAVIIAHRLSTVRKADRIIVLHHGRIIETGSHETLMAREGFYYRLHQLQT